MVRGLGNDVVRDGGTNNTGSSGYGRPKHVLDAQITHGPSGSRCVFFIKDSTCASLLSLKIMPTYSPPNHLT